MKSNFNRLGGYIEEIDERNVSGSEENLLGISVSKCFIPSIANTIGTNWKKYKVIHPGDFAYIPDTSRRGDKIAIAYYNGKQNGLVSEVYTVFRIIRNDLLLPEFLFSWFKRPEFDRYARFMSVGSVREIFDWNALCNVELPVPPIDIQRKKVDEMKTISRLISSKEKINNNL